MQGFSEHVHVQKRKKLANRENDQSGIIIVQRADTEFSNIGLLNSLEKAKVLIVS